MAEPFPFRTNHKYHLTGSRLEEHIRNICLCHDAMTMMVMVHDGHGDLLRNIGPDSWSTHPSEVTGLTVAIPGLSVLAHALKNQRFDPVFIIFNTALEEPPEWAGRSVSLVNHFFHDTAAAQFVLFFEHHYGTMKQACRFDYSAMENTWKFGRRIRDAISHGGVFTINDENFQPVTWRGYTISRERNGETLSDTFKVGDLVVLMCELDRALPQPDAESPSPEK